MGLRGDRQADASPRTSVTDLQRALPSDFSLCVHGRIRHGKKEKRSLACVTTHYNTKCPACPTKIAKPEMLHWEKFTKSFFSVKYRCGISVTLYRTSEMAGGSLCGTLQHKNCLSAALSYHFFAGTARERGPVFHGCRM